MIQHSREVLCGWGRANHARSLVYRPCRVDEVAEAVADARRRGLTVAHRGAGQSYGDAALNQAGAVVSMEGLDRINEYDPERGVVRAEAGVTIGQLCRHVIADGWWPPVVPGTSHPTLGGCFAMNVHGKNHLQAGSFAEHVRSITVLGSDGHIDLYQAGEDGFSRQVGAQGLQGTIVQLTVKLKAIASGYLAVEARSARNLDETLTLLAGLADEHEHAVAWIDCFATESALGRGVLHGATCVHVDDPGAGQGLSVTEQLPAARAGGVLPRRSISTLLRLFAHGPGVRTLNHAKHLHARLRHPSSFLESHARFHFLLDYVPNWKQAYGSRGLIQYQFFVPAAAAHSVFRKALERQQRAELVSWLGVVKCHRTDPFASNYSVDGFSLALDFPVRRERLAVLMDLVADFDQLQREAGGSVYAAKDAVSLLGNNPPSLEGYATNLSRRWESTRGADRPS